MLIHIFILMSATVDAAVPTPSSSPSQRISYLVTIPKDSYDLQINLWIAHKIVSTEIPNQEHITAGYT